MNEPASATGTSARLERLLEELSSAIDADAGAGLYLDDGDGRLEQVAQSSGSSRRAFRLPRIVLRPGSDRAGSVEFISIPDVRGGFIVLERGRAEPFSSDDRAVARLYARQLADQVVVSGMRLRTGIWTRQLEAIQSIAAQLTRLTSVSEVASAICSETRRVIDYDNARVHLVALDGETLEPVAFRSHVREYAGETADGLRLRVGEGITGWVAANGRPLIVPDAANDPRTMDVPGSAEMVAESMLLVPMRYESAVTGVIVLSRLGLGRFDEDDLRLLQVLSDQAAVAVENARLLAGRDRLVEELAALLDISQAGSVARDEVTLAGILADKLLKATHADACSISRWDEGSTVLHVLGWQGADAGDTTGRMRDPAAAAEQGTHDHPGMGGHTAVGGTIDVLGHPLTRRVLLDGMPQLLHRMADDVDIAERRVMESLGAHTLLMLPLNAGGRTIGLASLYATSAARDFSEYEMNVYRTMANQAAAVLENARLVGQLRTAADIDQVTGANNHRHLQERLKQEVARASRTHSPVALLMIDLDGFKAINDVHGHGDGDRVLHNVAAGLKLAVRTNDVVARYGGDEFVVLMPDTDEAAGRVVAERVVAGVRNQRHQLSDGSEGRVSCSAGLAIYPDDGRTAAMLLKMADAAMYSVKRAGGSAVRRGVRATRPPAAPTPTDGVVSGV